MECFSTSSHTGICGFLCSYLTILNEVALSVFAYVYNNTIMVVTGCTNSASNLGCAGNDLPLLPISCCHFCEKCLNIYLLFIVIQLWKSRDHNVLHKPVTVVFTPA
jgi:hypothetical protein